MIHSSDHNTLLTFICLFSVNLQQVSPLKIATVGSSFHPRHHTSVSKGMRRFNPGKMRRIFRSHYSFICSFHSPQKPARHPKVPTKKRRSHLARKPLMFISKQQMRRQICFLSGQFCSPPLLLKVLSHLHGSRQNISQPAWQHLCFRWESR